MFYPFFLGEAAGIGFLGGLGGVVIGWLSGQASMLLPLSILPDNLLSKVVYRPAWRSIPQPGCRSLR